MVQHYGEPLSGVPFHDRRRTGIGGSDAAAILGVSPYASALSVWESKRRHMPGDEPSERMVWGSRLERAVLDGYAEDFSVKVRAGRFHRSKRYEQGGDHFVIGHLDGEAADRIVEVKVISRQGEDWGAPDSEDVPAHYYAQVQHYLMLREMERADLIALVGGREARRYVIDRNDAFLDALVTEEAALWQKVQENTPPDPDGSDSAAQTLRRLFPYAVPEEMVATPETSLYASAYLTAKATKSDADKAMKEAQHRIEAAMGSKDRMVGDGWAARWGNVDGRLSWQEVAARFRDLLIPHYTDDALDAIQEAQRGDSSRRFSFSVQRKRED